MRKICRLTSFNFKWVLVYILTSTVCFFYDSNQKIAICAKSMYMHSFFLKVTYLLIFTRQNIVWIEHLTFYFFMEKNGFQTFVVSIQVIELDCLLWSKATVMSLVVIVFFLARRCANWYFNYKHFFLFYFRIDEFPCCVGKCSQVFDTVTK